MKVVASYTDSDALSSSNYEMTYQYRDIDITLDGRGVLGFKEIRTHDLKSDLVTSREFYREHPYTGLPTKVRVYKSNNGVLSEKLVSTFEYGDPRGRGSFKTVLRSLESEVVIRRESGPDVTTKKFYSYDAYGNVLKVDDKGSTVDSSDDVQYCKTYQNLTGPVWRIGFIKTEAAGKSCNSSCTCSTYFNRTKNTYEPGERMLVSKTEAFEDTNSRWLADTFTYDSYGNVLTKTGADGVKTTFVYESDFHTFFESSTVSGGDISLTTEFKYEPGYGNLLESVNANGLVLKNEYDKNGRLTRRRGPKSDGSGSVVLEEIAYLQSNSSHISVRRRTFDDKGEYVQFQEYADAFGRADVSYSSGSGNNTVIQQSTTFDVAGRLSFQESPRFAGDSSLGTSYVYDDVNRIIEKTLINGSKTTSTYSGLSSGCQGCVIKHVVKSDSGGANQRTTIRYLDLAGRVRKIDHADGHTQEFTYDPAGRLIKSKDPKVVSTFVYDTLGRQVSGTYPHNGTKTYEYDGTGRMSKMTDARGMFVNFQYDAVGRVVKRIMSAGREITFEYDSAANGNGHLARAYATANGNERMRYEFAYDVYGRIVHTALTQDGEIYNFHTDFDRSGRPKKVTYPDGSILAYSYDSRGRATELKLDGESLAKYSNFTARGQAGTVEYGNGVQNQKTYDSAGLLDGTTLAKGSTTHQDLNYDYNSLFLIKKIADNLTDPALKNTRDFTYDARGYLKRVDSTLYGVKTYAYDKAGNLTNKAGTALSYTGHQLQSGGGYSYGYDATGNRTSKTKSGENWDYDYNTEGLLNQVFKNSDAQARYFYGPFGQRVKMTDHTGSKERITRYISELMEVVEIGADAQYTLYVMGPEGRLASRTISGAPALRSVQMLAPLLLTGLYSGGSLHHRLMRVSLKGKYLFSLPGSELYLKYGTLALISLLILGLYVYFRRNSLGNEAYLRRNRRMAPMVPAMAILFLAFTVFQCQADRPTQLKGLWNGVEQALGLSTSLSNMTGDNPPGYPRAGLHYFHQDHISSTALLTDASGAVVSRMTYLPYGGIHEYSSSSTGGTDMFRAKFNDKEFDRSTGLYYFGARYYDPEVGRFVSVDSLAVGGPQDVPGNLNRYQFSGNNPITYNDPTGNFFFIAAMIFLAVATTYISVAASSGEWNPGKWTAREWGSALISLAGFALGFGIGAVTTKLATTIALETVLGAVEEVALAAIEGKTGMDLLRAGLIGGVTGGVMGAAGAAAGGDFASSSRKSMGTRMDQCFAAGTPIETEDGSKPIEEIKVGETVLSMDETTGRKAYKRVKRIFITKDNPAGELELATEDGDHETFTVTSEHPYYVEGKGWVEAWLLRKDMKVRASDGGELKVVRVWRGTGKIRTYNFEVEDYHTYFAGRLQAWVHNVCNTRTFYRKMGPGEAAGTAAENALQAPVYANGKMLTNGKKYLSSSLEKARAFNNSGVEFGTRETIFEFGLDAGAYKKARQGGVFQGNIRSNPGNKLKLEYHYEGINRSLMRGHENIGVPVNMLPWFNGITKSVQPVDSFVKMFDDFRHMNVF